MGVQRGPAWLVGILTLAVCVGCGSGKAAASSVDELVVVIGKSGDEAVGRILVDQQATALGSSGDEVAKAWLPRFRSVRASYEGMDPQARAVACDVVTGWAGARATPDPGDDLPAELRVAGAVANLNRNAANAAFVSQANSALTAARAGEPIALEVLLMQTGTCAALG